MYSTAKKYITSNDFIHHNLVFFVGSLLIAVFNYLYYPVIGRLVSVSDFGEIQALISLFTQLGIILTAFGYVITNITNNAADSNEYKRLVIALEQITLVVCVILFLLLCAFSFTLQSSLQFTSIVPMIMVGFLIILNVPATSRTYFLQGKKKLKEVSIAGIIFAAGKLAISVGLILAGLDIIGVMLAYIIAETLTLVYLLFKSKKGFPSIVKSLSFSREDIVKDFGYIRIELIYGLAVLILLFGITLLYTSDTIIIRFFFNPHDAGIYSGIAAVARIVFFVTASVAGVLIATIKMKNAYAKNLRILYKSFGLVTLIGGGVALFFTLFPQFSIGLLMGEQYIESASLLPVMSLTLLVCSYNNLLISYEIALRRFKVIYIVAVSIVVLSVLISAFHDTLTHIILGYLAANLVVFVLLSIQVVKRKNNV